MQRTAFFQKFEANAAEFPEAVAIETSEYRLSYGGINAQANALARFIKDHRADGESPVVGLAMAAGSDYVVAMLAAGKAGAAFAPLPPDLPERRLASYLERTKPSLLIAQAEHLPELAEKLNGIGHGHLKRLAVPPAGTKDSGNPGRSVAPGEPCYVMFTSGSTGEPKAILGQQRGLSHFLAWELAEFGIGRECRGSWLAPVGFDVSLRDILVPLMAGGTLCIPDENTRLTPHRLVEWIANSAVTLVHCVPTTLRLMNREMQARFCRPETPIFPALRHLLIAGEPLFGADIADWRHLAGDRAEMVNLYGPSETTLAKLFHRIGPETPEARQRVPIGLPLPNTDV
ncbi:MAG: AMP-binding protein, partial [Alphaproteobacteria bacterium]|nr:AMP-binding protein [Alphaproteobacteria bacterium]